MSDTNHSSCLSASSSISCDETSFDDFSPCPSPAQLSPPTSPRSHADEPGNVPSLSIGKPARTTRPKSASYSSSAIFRSTPKPKEIAEKYGHSEYIYHRHEPRRHTQSVSLPGTPIPRGMRKSKTGDNLASILRHGESAGSVTFGSPAMRRSMSGFQHQSSTGSGGATPEVARLRSHVPLATMNKSLTRSSDSVYENGFGGRRSVATNFQSRPSSMDRVGYASDSSPTFSSSLLSNSGGYAAHMAHHYPPSAGMSPPTTMSPPTVLVDSMRRHTVDDGQLDVHGAGMVSCGWASASSPALMKNPRKHSVRRQSGRELRPSLLDLPPITVASSSPSNTSPSSSSPKSKPSSGGNSSPSTARLSPATALGSSEADAIAFVKAMPSNKNATCFYARQRLQKGKTNTLRDTVITVTLAGVRLYQPMTDNVYSTLDFKDMRSFGAFSKLELFKIEWLDRPSGKFHFLEFTTTESLIIRKSVGEAVQTIARRKRQGGV
eukprot:TRINITY_DN6151_c0_g1_i1.p1 TRINITY_DN6151_c0_g1~~TRINITY_DN6151_c0_g1_i1.p1  ORF type:complete len:492 (-),score=76.52 TRINITY_DN6151_c0_g1_i1:154-1629(-)